MARWRDVKKGKLSFLNKKSTNEFTKTFAIPLMPRFKAFVTDTFMLLMPLMYIVFYFVMGSREAFSDDKISGWVYIFLPHFITVVSFWYFKAQTPGMRAYEIALVDSSNGKQPSLSRLIIRYISMILSIFLILPILMPYFNKNKKTLWDFISGTSIKLLPNDTI